MDEELLHQLQERVNDLEKRVDFLYARMNFPHETTFYPNPQFIEAMQKGDKIEAIKVYRGLTGCDLLTAKNAVESMWNQYH